MAELVVFLRDRELARTPIMAAETTIGRDASCDVVLDNAGVSRTHAVVLYKNGRFYIRDAGSENGLTLNGREASDAPLDYGDVVGINKFRIHFGADGGVSPDLLSPPPQAAPRGPRSVVATITLNAVAARQLHDQLLARGQPGPPPAAPAPPWPPGALRTVFAAGVVLALSFTAALLLR